MIRIRDANEAPVRADGRFVIYWMTAYRRARFNFALQRAGEWCRELGRPVLVVETLGLDYPHASDRFHRFVIDGMRDNVRAFEHAGLRYLPYVEREEGEAHGMLQALAKHACVIVTDDYPAFIHPRLIERAARRVDIRLEAVDSCGLLPLSATDRDYRTVHGFRRHLQRVLPDHLADRPVANPLASGSRCGWATVPREILSRWPPAPKAMLERAPNSLAALPIDHGVPEVPYDGGSATCRRRLQRFVSKRIPGYAEERNEPEIDATSGLSPYLHFGHISSHEIFDAVARREGWSPDALARTADGRRQGWWGATDSAEAFFEQLVTWRELGFNFCRHRDDATQFDGLPDWARGTLVNHATDPRPHVFDLADLEAGRTYDPLWNAAMGQLRRDGRIHGTLRMLWGKKVIEWSRTPTDALATLLHLNDRWAVDGRDPNSYAGIGWCFGRYDRPWGPEREIFGTVRYLSSVRTAKKMSVGAYVRRWL